MRGTIERRRRTLTALALGACLVARWAPGARAGEVPGNAPARSLGVAPLLVDSPALVSLFPQRAVADTAGAFGATPGGSILWATTDSDPYTSDERNLGALGRWGSVGFFVLAQPNYLLGGDFAQTGETPPSLGYFSRPYSSTSSVLQAGAGARWGGVRAGLAFRATRNRSDSGDGSTGSDGSSHLSGSQNELDYRELAFGLGADFRGATVDAEIEWQDESYEEAYGQVQDGTPAAITLDGELRGASGFAVRADVPAGPRLRVVAAGSYHWGDRTWSGTRYEVTGEQAIRFGERAETWGAHLAFVAATRLVERLVFAGSFVRYDEPLSGLSNSAIQATTQRISNGVVTVAAEKAIWRTLVMRAGVSGAYEKSEGTSNSESPDGTNTSTRALEELSDSFHWGLAYRWRSFRFETALRSPPVVDTPFEHFDLYWSF